MDYAVFYKLRAHYKTEDDTIMLCLTSLLKICINRAVGKLHNENVIAYEIYLKITF